ncbi:MAG: hypothetical protein V1736_10770 [Pseudomonadota bacterium]
MILSALLMITQGPAYAAEPDQDRRVNVEPLFFLRTDKTDDIEALGPFFSYGLDGRNEGWAVRPLLSYQSDRSTNTEEWQFLYPLGRYRLTPQERQIHFLPFLSSTRDLKKPSEETLENKFDLFPVFWGKTGSGETYGGVFPVYGRFRERFLRDEITFFLWPLYSKSRWEGNEKTTLIWPLLSWTTGEKEQAFRLWPLFGHEKKTGEYDRNFLLWPIFFCAKEDLDTEPLTRKMVFPLYVSETSATINRKIVLWPLFNYYRDTANDYTQWDLPWPVMGYGQGENLRIRKLWPLFHLKESPNLYDFTLLWPLYRYTREDLVEDKAVRTTCRFLLINKSEKTVWVEEDETESTARLWPLFFAKSYRDGSEILHFPAIIPTEDEGYERNYGPIFRIYEYKRSKDGEETSNLFWGLYRSNCKAGRCLRELSFLASWEFSPEESRVTILHGLFEYLRTTGSRTLKLLYIPEVFTRSAGESVAK